MLGIEVSLECNKLRSRGVAQCYEWSSDVISADVAGVDEAAPNKDDIGFCNVFVRISTEEQIMTTASQDNICQPWLIYR